MEIVDLRSACELICKKQQEQEEEDQQQEQEGAQLVTTAVSQDNTKSNSLPPLQVASSPEQRQDEKVMAVVDVVPAAVASDRMKSSIEVAAAQGGRIPRRLWGDCLPQVALLRKALLSSAPDIAVLGPLHGCFAFYVTHLHNEVLSSPYAKTMTLGANVTRLESAFMWVGGWRPTSALVLIYSLMGIDVEDALQAASDGRDVGECSTSFLLSTRQLAVMHALQKHTQLAEMKISKKLTVLQMIIGEQDVLEAVLKDAASPVANDSSRFRQVAEKRISRFQRLLVQAEELRLHTLKDLLSLLTPIQAARCGVAVFEICSSIRVMGSTLVPTSPALITRPTPLPLPYPSALVEKSSMAGIDEPVVPDPSSESIPNSSDAVISLLEKPTISHLSTCDNSILNSFDAPRSVLQKPVVSDLYTFGKNILNSEVLSVSESYEPLASNVSPSSNTLHTPDVQLHQSDEIALLVPSCSESSSSQLLTQDSSRAFEKDQKSNSWRTIVPLVGLNLDDVADGDDSSTCTTDEHQQRVDKGSEGNIVSNRLLLLSPASSDVAIQDCSLDSSGLPSYFETPPQLPCARDDMEISYQEQPGDGESYDMGESCRTPPGRASVPCECAQQGSQSKEGRKALLRTRA